MKNVGIYASYAKFASNLFLLLKELGIYLEYIVFFMTEHAAYSNNVEL